LEREARRSISGMSWTIDGAEEGRVVFWIGDPGRVIPRLRSGVQIDVIEPSCEGPDGKGAYQIGGERSDCSHIICLDKR
jgi:hypothetical protein